MSMIDYALKYSLENKDSIIIIYQKGLDITQRKIEVRKIDENIIQAYCFKRKGLRKFKVENILACMISGELVAKSTIDIYKSY